MASKHNPSILVNLNCKRCGSGNISVVKDSLTTVRCEECMETWGVKVVGWTHHGLDIDINTRRQDDDLMSL